MKHLLLILLMSLSAYAAEANNASEEQRIGAMVIAIDAALKKPADAKSFETMVEFGHDSRHYVMIRGWMAELLKGGESQLAATGDPTLKNKHQQKVDFLKKVIRRIDLE